MSEQIRILRVIEYIGDRAFIEQCMLQDNIKGQRQFEGPYGKLIIKSAYVGITPEVLERPITFHDPNKPRDLP